VQEVGQVTRLDAKASGLQLGRPPGVVLPEEANPRGGRVGQARTLKDQLVDQSAACAVQGFGASDHGPELPHGTPADPNIAAA
jgi:hypothetical protein